ncbi:MAG: hypothetical protein E7541_04455 [Ruminococcaceae bacterium]|nr:hypothetical protein [Oscillospiraceae bacterium]
MEELSDKINRLLSDPESLQKIQGMMAALGGGEAPTEETPPAPPSPPPADTGGGLPDMEMLSRLLPLVGSLSQENDDTRLLQALRPYLHGERAGRLDETMKLLRLIKLLPLLQGGGNHG